MVFGPRSTQYRPWSAVLILAPELLLPRVHVVVGLEEGVLGVTLIRLLGARVNQHAERVQDTL